MKTFERHPLSAAWPDMAADEYEDLKADIKANNLYHPVKLFEGKILDGWHRYRACREVGAPLRTEKFDGNKTEAAAYAKAANGSRRNTTASQRALAYAEITKWAERGRPDNSAPGAELSTVRRAAQEARVSDRTMHQAKVVAEKGALKLKEAVRSGEISLKKATKVVDLPKSEQLAAAKEKAAPPVPPENWQPDEDEEAKAEIFERNHAAAMDKILAADDRLSAANEEIKRLHASVATLTVSRNGYQNQCGELIRRIRGLQRENERLKRQAA